MTAAAQLARHPGFSAPGGPGARSIVIVEPKDQHWYQPMWTMIGGGLGFKKENSMRPFSAVLPQDVQHVSNTVERFNPNNNEVTLKNGQKLTYDYLIVTAGLKVDWDKIQGLKEAVEDPECPVATIYDYNTAEKVEMIMKQVKQGDVFFTQPACPIKCGGAPQKVMWLQEAGYNPQS